MVSVGCNFYFFVSVVLLGCFCFQCSSSNRASAAQSVISLSTEQQQPPTNVLLIKVGGSSITDKAVKETLNNDAIRWFARTIRKSEVNNERSNSASLLSFVIVHGAGSFGHHTAKEYGLAGNGGLQHPASSEPPDTLIDNEDDDDDDDNYNEKFDSYHRSWQMLGLGRTRLSVQKLNHAVVSAFLEQNVSAVGISPCFGAMPVIQATAGVDDDDAADQQKNRLLEVVHKTVQAGLIPILHGDACLLSASLHNAAGAEAGASAGASAAILSGDTIMEMLGTAPWITQAMFLTDVEGVYTSDPHLDNMAKLIRTLHIDMETAEIVVPSSSSVDDASFDATGSTHEHDVTGGLKTKLSAAASIAASGKNVTIVRCGSTSAEHVILRAAAANDDVSSMNHGDWDRRATVLMPMAAAGTCRDDYQVS